MLINYCIIKTPGQSYEAYPLRDLERGHAKRLSKCRDAKRRRKKKPEFEILIFLFILRHLLERQLREYGNNSRYSTNFILHYASMYTFTTRTLSKPAQKSSTIPGRPKVVGTLKLHHVGRGELASCFNSFVWDCRR